MMWVFELLAFVPAMIAANTPFPIPSDAVLLAFAGGRPPAFVVALATVGAICAGVGGLIELRLAAAIVPSRDPVRWWFYPVVVGAAALPLPFTSIRILLLRSAPRPLPYAAAIAIGRFPRYLAEAFLVAHLTTPAWLSLAATGGTVLVLAVYRSRQR